MSDDRRLAVLQAIVADYVLTSEPVGSKALVERHDLQVSPATIRNDMAVLEEEGYLSAPHTSAGRIPTDKGYRLFVDRLAGVKPLSAAERNAITTLLDSAVDLDDMVNRAVRLLAQLTQQVAVMQYPSLTRSKVRHVDVVPVAERRVLVVLITETGRVEQRLVETPHSLSAAAATVLRERINERTASLVLTNVADALNNLHYELPEVDQEAAAAVLTGLRAMVATHRDERIVLAGHANLTRTGPEFRDNIATVLSAIEEQVVLLRLLSDMAADAREVGVRIGHENTHLGLLETSVVTSEYRSGGEVMGRLGILGPTRMDYPNSIAAVRAVARYVSRILAGS